MSSTPSTQKRHRGAPHKERRTSKRLGPLGWIKSLLARPMRLERSGRLFKLVLVDRRRLRADGGQSLTQMRDELRDRLLLQDDGRTTEVLRHLVFVHHELGRRGWRGVQALPAGVLSKALVQAQMVVDADPTPALNAFVEKLRLARVAADVRENQAEPVPARPAAAAAVSAPLAAAASALSPPAPINLEVSEATQEEFEEMERSWVGELPAGLSLVEIDR